MTDAGRRRRGRPEDGSLIPSWVGAPSDRSRASDREERPPTVSPSRAFHEAAPATAAGPRQAGAAPEGRTCQRRGATSSRLRGATVALEKDSLSKRFWLQS